MNDKNPEQLIAIYVHSLLVFTEVFYIIFGIKKFPILEISKYRYKYIGEK